MEMAEHHTDDALSLARNLKRCAGGSELPTTPIKIVTDIPLHLQRGQREKLI